MNRADVHALIQPRLGSIVADAWPGSRLTVIVVAHDDSSRPQQQTLYRLLEHVVERRPDLPLLVEGFAGPPSSRAAILESPRRIREASSAIDRGEPAVQVLARLHPAPTAVLGVDSEPLIANQRAEVVALDAASLRDARPALAVLLEEVERLARSPRCERILAARDAFERSGDVTAFGEELAVHAGEMGVSLAGYPNLVARRAALAKQKFVDAHKLEPERVATVQRLIRISERRLDPARASAVGAWLARTGLPLGEIVGQAAAESQPAWLKAHSTLSLGLRAGPASSAHYYAQLSELAAALGVELSGALRRHCDHVVLARSVDSGALLVELSALTDELADRTVSSAVEHGVLALRRELRELDQLLHLRLPAAQVRRVLATHPGAVQWTLDVLRLGMYLRPDLWLADRKLADASRRGTACALVVDQRLAHVRDYYFYALCRSAQLISGAIARGLDSTQAVALVCERFHLHEIVRVLRSENELSWAIVVPHDEPHD